MHKKIDLIEKKSCSLQSNDIQYMYIWGNLKSGKILILPPVEKLVPGP